MLKGPPQPGVEGWAKSTGLLWNAPEVFGDGFIALRVGLSGGFMFYVELSEVGVHSSLLEKCVFLCPEITTLV